jgi:hypothetical protein
MTKNYDKCTPMLQRLALQHLLDETDQEYVPHWVVTETAYLQMAAALEEVRNVTGRFRFMDRKRRLMFITGRRRRMIESGLASYELVTHEMKCHPEDGILGHD